MSNELELASEFNRAQVHWRVQGKPYERNGRFSAMALAYIDARDVMDRLDAVCGPSGWQDRYEVTPNGLIIANIGIKFGEDWIWKSDGAGETAVEGKKGGMSDALKRCAVKWGIGRYLYRLDSPWVQCEVRKNGQNVAWKAWAEDPWSRVKVTTYTNADETREPSNGLVTKEQAEIITDMATRADTDRSKVFSAMKVQGDSWADLPANLFDTVSKGIAGKLAKMDAEHDAATRNADLGGDEIPL